MKELLACFIGIILLVFVCIGLGFFAQGTNFFMYKYWAPKYANVERQVYEGTNSYHRGNAMEMQKLQMEYNAAPADQKDTLGTIILDKSANWDIKDFPPQSQQFLDKLRNERLNPVSSIPVSPLVEPVTF
jgi:hypothetical protein